MVFSFTVSFIGFGQYIENATLKFEKIDQTISAKDVIYLNDKIVQFRNTEYPYVLSYAKLKKLDKIEFDSAQFHKEVPNLNETFSEKREGRGVYLTLDDVFTNNQSERKYKAKKIGAILYEYPGDLIDVLDTNSNKRIKDVAGLVYDENLYLSIKNIWENESEENGNYVMMHEKNTFVRVKYINDDFLYFELPLKGMGNFILSTSFGMFGAIGGAASALVSTNTPANYRPVILYKDNHEIFIIKNCEQFNEHFEMKNKNVKINCNNDDYNLNNIRKTIINKL